MIYPELLKNATLYGILIKYFPDKDKQILFNVFLFGKDSCMIFFKMYITFFFNNFKILALLKSDVFQSQGKEIVMSTNEVGYINYRVKMSLDSDIQNNPKMKCMNYDDEFAYSNCLSIIDIHNRYKMGTSM